LVAPGERKAELSSLSPSSRTAALDDLNLLGSNGHAPETLGELVTVEDLADAGLDAAAGAGQGLRGQRAVLLRVLAVFGEGGGEAAGGGLGVRARGVVDVL
jgi:hypothetical protein